MGKNPREPKHVKKLIADAQERKIENLVIRFIKGVRASNEAIRQRNANGGTRGNGRRQNREPGQ